jgi:hypothetical protein
MRDIYPEVKDILSKSKLSYTEYRTHYEIFVEMIDKSIELAHTPIYLIGNTVSKFIDDPTKTLTERNYSLTLTNPIVSYDNFFRIVSKKMIRILNLNALFPQFTEKLQVCTYKENKLATTWETIHPLIQCFNYSKDSVKYWKDLATNQVVYGLKLMESVVKVKIELLASNMLS